jgi:hypothetical protein
MWSQELTQFENEYSVYKGRREKIQQGSATVKAVKKISKK